MRVLSPRFITKLVNDIYKIVDGIIMLDTDDRSMHCMHFMKDHAFGPWSFHSRLVYIDMELYQRSFKWSTFMMGDFHHVVWARISSS